MKYYTHGQTNTMAKNKAQEEVQQYCHQVDGTLPQDESEVEEYVSTFRSKVEQINQENKRCQNLDFNEMFYPELGSRSIYVGNVASVSFYPVKHESAN